MKIVAFMESPSVAVITEESDMEQYRNDQVYHREMLRRSMSGNRLMMAFGKSMYEEIWWDNVAPMGTVDRRHVEDVIIDQEPKLILTFGKIAQEAVGHSIGAMPLPVMDCHHPNARGKTQGDLDQFANRVRTFIRNFDLKERMEQDRRNIEP